jgi:hypothetical protein
LHDFVADIEKLVQAIELRLLKTQDEEPACLLEVGDPIEARKYDIESSKSARD